MRSHPLMDDEVDHEGGEPVFYKRNVVFTHLVVDKISTGRKRKSMVTLKVLGFSPMHFQKGDFPSGNFQNVQFPKRKLPKGSVRPSEAPQAVMGTERLGNCTVGKLSLGKITLGICHLVKIFLENTQNYSKSTISSFPRRNHKYTVIEPYTGKQGFIMLLLCFPFFLEDLLKLFVHIFINR